ncbi:MAG TPA: ribosome assembly RNA-binding protein YhbY [Pseudomonadales bacterium]|nr:ribosome assembly RNA-binding protein YhbY [Pseudomonadales bacterium]
MTLVNSQRKQFKAIGHKLKPIVTLAQNGLSENVLKEIERALNDHELIKIKIHSENRDEKIALIEDVCQQTSSTLVQTIGNIALIYRSNPQANPKLSNILRNSSLL